MESSSSSPVSGQQVSCRCSRCCRRSQLPPAGVLQNGEVKLSDKLSNVYQASQAMGYGRVSQEPLDELDEFVLDSGHWGPIQDGENPPYDASCDSLSHIGSHTRTRSLTPHLMSSQLQEKLQRLSVSQSQRRPRLIRMEDVVNTLWEKTNTEFDEEYGSLEDAMRASFYRPSMNQCSRRTDVDLTATWHGDMLPDLDPMRNGYNARAIGSGTGSYVTNLFSQDSSVTAQSQSKLDYMNTYGHPLLMGNSEENSTIFGKDTSSSGQKLDKGLKKSVPSIVAAPFQRLKDTLNRPGYFMKVSRPKKWSWTRCVERIQKLKNRSRRARDPTGLRMASTCPSPLPSRPQQRIIATECFSCLAPGASSDISSLDFNGGSPMPVSFIHDCPFLTTSALFDAPRTPGALGTPTSLPSSLLSTCIGGKKSPNDLLPITEHGMAHIKEPQDIVDIWDDSSEGSSHGSMLATTCWVPPVFKTDKEYEACRVKGNNHEDGRVDYGVNDSVAPGQHKKMGPTISQQWSTLSSQSSWDLHSVNIDKATMDVVCSLDP